MQLFIMRHGQAHHSGNIDSQRELTPQGYQEVKVMAKWFKNANISIDHVFVSPYVRAQQTATTLVNEFTHKVAVTTLDFITPSGNAKNVQDYLDGICQSEHFGNILVVSHMPLVSYLVEQLTVDHQSPIFQTAAIAQIAYDEIKMSGELAHLISPYDVQ